MPRVARARPLRAMLSGLLAAPLYRNAYALLVSTGASAILGMLYWLAAARLYPVTAFGLNAAAISIMIFLSGIAQLNMMSAFNRFIPTAGRATARFVLGGYVVSGLLTLSVAWVYGMGLRLWSPELAGVTLPPAFPLLFAGATVAWTIFALQDHVLAGLREAAWVPVENILYGLAKIALLVALQPHLPQFGIFVSWTLPTMAAILPVNALIFGRLIPRHQRVASHESEPATPGVIARYVAGNYVGSLFGLASVRLLPVMVMAGAGAVANAHFYLAWTIANTLHLMAMNMSVSFTVEGALDQGLMQGQARRFFIHKLQLLLPAVAALILAAPWILRLSGAEYALEGTAVFRLLVLATIPRIVTALYLSMARVRQELRNIVATQAASSLSVLGLSLLLLPVMGITGVGVSFLVSESLVALAILGTSWRSALLPAAVETTSKA